MKNSESDQSRPSVRFLGAAQAISGSMHLLEFGGYQYLMDCGADRMDRGSTRFDFDPVAIDGVFLSHAHVDHCGNLPLLVRRGYRGPIYCTPATQALVEVMLNDIAKRHERARLNETYRPYSSRRSNPDRFYYQDVDATLDQCVAVPFDHVETIHSSLSLRFIPAGHILGSAMVSLTMDVGDVPKSVLFTGDIGRRGLPYLASPDPLPAADLLICESTYGGKVHDTAEVMASKMNTILARTIDAGGKVLIPAFSLHRTQIVLYYLQLWMNQGVIPRLPIFVDSPVGALISEVYAEFQNELQTEFMLEDSANVRWFASKDEAEMCSLSRETCIILGSGGMCDGGRISDHIEWHIDDPRCTIAMVGFQAPGSIGAQILAANPTVRLRGRWFNKWIETAQIGGFSGHADQHDFRDLLSPTAGKTGMVRLVHGELDQMHCLKNDLESLGFGDVKCPSQGERVWLS
jgi:metallo-beta-lactamase family protein